MKRNLTVIRFGKYRFQITIEDFIIFKAVLTVGLLAIYFLPIHLAAPVTVATNLIWLWRG